MREGDYDSNNEHGLLRYNGPYRYRTSGPSFNVVKYPEGIYTTKVIKVGQVKIYGTPIKANNVKEEEVQ